MPGLSGSEAFAVMDEITRLRRSIGETLRPNGLRNRIMPRFREEVTMQRIQLNGILVEQFKIRRQ